MQTKLLAFPRRLPERVIRPQLIATDKGKIIGYLMAYVEGRVLRDYGSAEARKTLGLEEAKARERLIRALFKDLHQTVTKLHAHKAEVVIGDFNDTNVLVKGKACYLCDPDSFQFRSASGLYPCEVFKPEFIDPLLIDYRSASPELTRIEGGLASRDTDWYAYTVMLFRSLTLVYPYGGIYKPRKNISLKERLRERITVFHQDVIPPAFALPPDSLPPPLRRHFKAVFGSKNRRGTFPLELLQLLPGGRRPSRPAPPVPASAALAVEALRFYESGQGIPEEDTRVYSTCFPKHRARFINFELRVQNKRYKKTAQTYEVVARYYRPDSSVLGTDGPLEFRIKSSTKEVVFSGRLGWEKPGYWQSGTYRAEFVINGEVFAKGSFTIERWGWLRRWRHR